MAIRTGHETAGLRKNRHGTAAMAKRSVVMSSGENSLSANRRAIKPNPQVTATRTAMAMSAGFIVVPSSPAYDAVIARSAATKQSKLLPWKHSGLLRFARNDG